jgi:hypothetical protein
MSFAGQGFVVVQPSEEVPHAGGGGPAGGGGFGGLFGGD